MKITFEGCECSCNFSMGAISIDLDPKETEVIVNADVRKYEIGEGDTTEQIRRTIFACVKDAVGSAMAQQQKPKELTKVSEDKPKPEPNVCSKPVPVEEDVIVDLEEEPKKHYGPKRRAAQK